MIKHFSQTFLSSLIILLINFIAGIITARLLGPTGKGELTAVTLWPSIFVSIGSLGISEAIVFFVSQSDDFDIKKLWSGAFFIAIIQSLILASIGFFLLPLLLKQYSNNALQISRLYLLFIPLNLITQYQISIFRGRLSIKTFNILRVSLVLSYVLFIIILWVTGKVSVKNCTLALLISNAITLIIRFILIKKNNWSKYAIDLAVVKDMLKFGLRAHLGNLSSLLNIRFDQMIMALFISPELLGLYAVGVTISSAITIVPNSLAILALPTISGSNDRERKIIILVKTFRFSLWATALLSIFLIVFTPITLKILYGEAYLPASLATRILFLASLVSGQNLILSSSLKGLNKPIISSYGEFLGLGTTILFLVLLLPCFQILGAALASLLAYSVNFLYMLYYTSVKFDIPLRLFFEPQKEDEEFAKTVFRKCQKKLNLYSEVA